MNLEKVNRTQGPKKPNLNETQRFLEGFCDFEKKTLKSRDKNKIELHIYKMMYI